MERNNAAERAAWLRAQIAENSDLYYNSDAPKISDFEYDAMFEELRSIEAAFPELDSPDSPTHRVGGKASEKFSKVTHRVPLGSLTDVVDRESLEDFVRRMKETLGDGVRFTVEPKIDGLSVAAEYRGGKLIRAATRGDGKVGEDITENARTIASLPKEVAYGGNFCVRGEGRRFSGSTPKTRKTVKRYSQIREMPRRARSASSIRRSRQSADLIYSYSTFSTEIGTKNTTVPQSTICAISDSPL